MTIVLFDNSNRRDLYPLTATRALADLRMGLYTVRQRWKKLTNLAVEVLTADYLQPLYGFLPVADYLLVDAAVIPDDALVQRLFTLQPGSALADDEGLVMGLLPAQVQLNSQQDWLPSFAHIEKARAVKRIRYPWHLVQHNATMISADVQLYDGKKAVSDLAGVTLQGSHQIFVHPEAHVETCSLNATAGPIVIDKGAVIMEGCLIRGPFFAGEGSVIKMGTKVYGGTTIGPYCVVGGEVKNSIITGYSNKAHDGYLGDSIIGEWCNLGAGTSNSNLKNTAGDIKMWSPVANKHVSAGNKCGLIMGDYTRSAINTSFNTGTSVGVCCNVFDQQLTPRFIPNFSWGSTGVRYQFEKAVRDISNWMALKNMELQPSAISVLKHIFGESQT